MDANGADRRRLAKSGAISAGLWAGLFLLALVVPLDRLVAGPERKDDFTTVKLTLSSPVSAKVPPSASLAAGGRAASPGAASSAPAGKPSALSATPGRAASRPESKGAGGLGIPNFGPPSAAAAVRADDGGDSLEFSSPDSAPSRGAPPRGTATKAAPSPVQEVSGVAGTIDTVGGSRVASSGKASSRSGGGSSSVSSDTALALGSIGGSGNGRSGGAGAGSGGSAGNGTGSSGSGSGGSASTGSGAGGTAGVSGLSFEGGSRRLISPSDPSVSLPARLARLVDSDRTVTVQLTVLADGTVPSGLVSFTPSAVLPAEIRDYLRKEFSSWRFEKGAADGQASFRYSIRVK